MGSGGLLAGLSRIWALPPCKPCNGRPVLAAVGRWCALPAARCLCCALPDARCLLAARYLLPFTTARCAPTRRAAASRVVCAQRVRAQLTARCPLFVQVCFDALLHGMTLQAWRIVLNVIGGDYKARWPDEESRIIFHYTLFAGVAW